MIKKVDNHKNPPNNNEKVEDIYGVHFKYEDLCDRLLKVQKERRKSEGKSPIIRKEVSGDARDLRTRSGNGKVRELVSRIKDSSLQPPTKDPHSLLFRKVKRKPNSEIFKTFSPREAAKKAGVINKIKKKNVSATKSLKKITFNNKPNKSNPK